MKTIWYCLLNAHTHALSLFFVSFSIAWLVQNNMGAFFSDPFMDAQFSGRQTKGMNYQVSRVGVDETW